ncbi:IQ and ubiquitin-like domain-containing protein [Venturia canescens]|uniref:IQ and ubiquitin-like domain-containing protein n=1 Tax=Venturia canescens TaxID=32260 RepID=UPI001C9D4EBA|nr:IQ and ubiquitin-like domain-containing protein [Venturia canescens]
MVFVVEIEDRCFAKPFLGGWKNVVTGREYHDARTQTCPRGSLVYPRGKKKHEDEAAPAAARSPASCAAARPAANVITETRDRCVGTDTSLAYRARVEFGALARLSRETRAQTPPKPEKIHHFRHCRSSRFEIVNLAGPSKRSDFELVQSVLERWRYWENARLDGGFFETSKLAERGRILGREIELLRSIEATKARVREERRERRHLADLDRLAEPEVWKVGSGGGRKILVETLRVQRARECRDFYRSLFVEAISAEDRLERLKKLREYAAEHTCEYARDLISSVDQEIELFGMSHDEKLMNSLKNRSRQALLRLTINSCSLGQKLGDNRASSPPRSRKPRKSFSKVCERCGRFLTIDDLSARIISPGQPLLPTCQTCRNSQPGKDAKIVYEPYDIMIRDLRIRETNLGSSPSSGDPAWRVDSRIIYRLVNYVWHGKSGISESDDLYRLVLVRFRPQNVWSPWNNLLLTKREAALHQSMQDPCQIYAPTIAKKFVVKNLQAKLRFDLSVSPNLL